MFRSLVHPVSGIPIQAEKNSEVLGNSECACFYRIGSSPRTATTMKNQDKKNGAAKPSGHTSNPKSNPGQVEAGPAGAQGPPSRAASAAQAEGSARQTPGKTEGVCQPCFPCGPGEELAVRQSSFWR